MTLNHDRAAPTIGSLFTGYGGLDMGVQAAIGGTVAWQSEIDPAASRVLAHHWPDVPNLGDITKADWTAVEPVDVLVGGFPCQDLSTAGKRAGLHGARSGLWAEFVRAIACLRPQLVVIENVRGLLSGKTANSRDVTNEAGRVVGRTERAMGRVLGDLADIGFDARWGLYRASHAGAPHRRERVFIIAAYADRDGPGSQGFALSAQWRDRQGRSVTSGGWGDAGPLMPTPKASDGPNGGPGMRNGRGKADALPGVVALLRTPTAQLAINGGSQHPDKRRGGGHGSSLSIEAKLLPTPTAADAKASGGGYSGQSNVTLTDATVRLGRFAQYAPAIARWEQVIGRPAPDPTEPNPRTGRPRLSPAFSEWMMGLPAGHVTGIPGLSYAAQLKLIGNGVVPQQAELAVKELTWRNH